MNMTKKIILFLLTLIIISCSKDKTVYFIKDTYSSELISDIIIEEFRKKAEKNRYDLSILYTGSAEETASLFESMNNGNDDKIVLSAFTYLNNYNTDTDDKLFIIGPYFDFNIKNTEVIGNIKENFENIELLRGTASISFFIDDNKDSFPEYWISSGIIKAADLNRSGIMYSFNNIADTDSASNIQNSDNLSVYIPESYPESLIEALSRLKNSYILFDFINFSDTEQFLSLPAPVTVMKYDYIGSFDSILSYENGEKGRQIIYSCSFEKK